MSFFKDAEANLNDLERSVEKVEADLMQSIKILELQVSKLRDTMTLHLTGSARPLSPHEKKAIDAIEDALTIKHNVPRTGS